MTKCVVVKSFEVSEDQPEEVLGKIERLRADGFSICWEGEPVVLAKTSPKAANRTDISAIVGEIQARHGISQRGVAALLGVSCSTLRKYCTGERRAAKSRWRDVCSLQRRSRSLPDGSSTLADEARGAARAWGLRGQSRRKSSRGLKWCEKLNSDQRLEIAVKRSGGANVIALSREYGVTPARIYQISKEISSSTSA